MLKAMMARWPDGELAVLLRHLIRKATASWNMTTVAPSGCTLASCTLLVASASENRKRL